MADEELVPHDIDTFPAIKGYFDSVEAWRHPVTRRDYFELVDENEFLDMTQKVASLVRGGSSTEQQSFDGKFVTLQGQTTPDHREKESLLRLTWQTAQEILRDRSLEDRDALEFAALTVAGGIVLAHPFADGNGRTSRALSFLIARGNEGSENLSEILANEAGGGSWYSTPNARMLFSLPKASYQELNIDMGDDMAGEGEDAYGGDIVDTLYNHRVLNDFIHEADSETLALLEPYIHDSEGNATAMIDGKALLEALAGSPRAMEYRMQIDGYLRRQRASTLIRFLDVMKNKEEVDVRSRLKTAVGSPKQRQRVTQKVLHVVDQEGKIALREQIRGIHRAASAVYDVDKQDGSAA